MLSGPFAHADGNTASDYSNGLPLSSMLTGTGVAPSAGEERFRLLAGDDYADIAANNPYVFYASMLGDPDSATTRQSNNIMVASAAAGEQEQVAPPPVPLPPAVYLMLSGLAALFTWLRPRRRGPV